MKINFGKLFALAGRIIVAAPVIVAAIKPILRPGGQPSAPGSPPVVAEGNKPS